MFFANMTFIGIDPTAGQKPFTYAALDQDLHLLALGEGSMDEVLAFVGGQRQAYAAVCAPRQPSQGILDRSDIREQLNPPPRPGRWVGFRLAEYQLRMHNISCPKTSSKEQDCPGWMRMGFIVYKRLEQIGYCPYPTESASLQWLEVYPHAGYCALLGLSPFPKHSLEGRIQRQLALDEVEVRVPDPMRLFEEITRHRLLQGLLPLDDLYSPSELDALLAAYTAWKAANQPGEIKLLGHPEEGQIVIPTRDLKHKY
jgi:hypothetical protein